MANTTTTTLAAAIPQLVSDAVKRTFDVSVLLGTCAIKYMGQGQGKTMKFPTLPYSEFAVTSESSPMSATAYTPGSGTATIVDTAYGLEISDFAIDTSALTVEDMIGELMLAAKEAQERQVANTYTSAVANLPVEASTLTVAKFCEADAKLAAIVGNSVYLAGSGFGGLVAGLSNVQYSSLKTQILDSKGLNGIGTNPVNGAWNDGQIKDLMGVQILPSRQVSLATGATADAVGCMYVRGATFGCALQREPYVTWERRAILPTGGSAGWIISVSFRQGVALLRSNHAVQIQTDS